MNSIIYHVAAIGNILGLVMAIIAVTREDRISAIMYVCLAIYLLILKISTERRP